MSKRFTLQKKIRLVLGALLLFVAGFSGLLWHRLGYSVSIPAVDAAPEEVVNVGTEVTSPRPLEGPTAAEVLPQPSIAQNVAPATPVEPSGLPQNITIPIISVRAAIEQVTLAKDGSMGVPKNAMHAGWYALGPQPGEVGSAVIDGHVNWYDGATGVFENLHTLVVGDTIEVQNDRGEVVTFVVRETRTFGAEDDATDVFTSSDGKAHLNLITCMGEWDMETNQYPERFVVFADAQ